MINKLPNCFFCGECDFVVIRTLNDTFVECKNCMAAGPHALTGDEAINLYCKAEINIRLRAFESLAILNQVHLPLAKQRPEIPARFLERRINSASREIDFLAAAIIQDNKRRKK